MVYVSIARLIIFFGKELERKDVTGHESQSRAMGEDYIIPRIKHYEFPATFAV